MKRFLSRVGAVLPSVIADISGIAGAGVLSYGAALVYEPAGFIVGGGLLLAGAFLYSRKAAA